MSVDNDVVSHEPGPTTNSTPDEDAFNAAEADLGTGARDHIPTLEKKLSVNELFNALSPREVKRWSLENPAAVINLLPEDLQARLMQLDEKLVYMDEAELENVAGLSRIDRRVRIAFWEEYERAAKKNEKINLEACVLHTGLMNWSQYAFRLDRPERLAWLLTPPALYKAQIKEALEIGTNRLIEIMSLPLYDHKGRVDAKVGALILAAYKMVDGRVHGSVMQRQLNVNVNTPGPDSSPMQNEPEDIDKKIAELEAEISQKRAQASGTNLLEERKDIRDIRDIDDAEFVHVIEPIEPPDDYDGSDDIP